MAPITEGFSYCPVLLTARGKGKKATPELVNFWSALDPFAIGASSKGLVLPMDPARFLAPRKLAGAKRKCCQGDDYGALISRCLRETTPIPVSYSLPLR